jgi:hypothetical protein
VEAVLRVDARREAAALDLGFDFTGVSRLDRVGDVITFGAVPASHALRGSSHVPWSPKLRLHRRPLSPETFIPSRFTFRGYQL